MKINWVKTKIKKKRISIKNVKNVIGIVINANAKIRNVKIVDMINANVKIKNVKIVDTISANVKLSKVKRLNKKSKSR